MFKPAFVTPMAGIAFLAVGALTALPGQERRAGDDRHRTRVQVATVREDTLVRSVRFPGVVRGVQHGALAFSVPGEIASRSAQVGDRVRAGDALAALEDREYRLAVDAAAALLAEIDVRLAQSDRELSRIEGLHSSKAATTEEWEQVAATSGALEASRTAAVARHEDAQRMVTEATLRAPWDGVVTAVHVQPGEWVAPGMPVVELASDRNLEVEIDVPESLVPLIETGSPVTVDLPLANLHTTGRLTMVACASPGPGRLFTATATLDHVPGLAAGMTTHVTASLPLPRGLRVPLEAVVNPGGSQPSVFRVQGGRAQRILVTPGLVNGETVVVEGSLAPGDLVVTTGNTFLVDGDIVEVH